MAFVYKSPRKFNYIESNVNDKPGPGHYLSTENEYKKIPKNKIPFLSGAKKFHTSYKVSDSPGPGAYFNQYQNLKDYNNLINSKNNNNQDTIYKVLDYDEVAKNSRFAKLLQEKMKSTGFLIKDKRFNNKIVEDIPGPGYYNRTDLNYFEVNTAKIEIMKKEMSKAKANINFYKNTQMELNNKEMIKSKNKENDKIVLKTEQDINKKEKEKFKGPENIEYINT